MAICGRLVFYRWPADTSWDAAPEFVRDVLRWSFALHCNSEVIPLIIHLGYDRGRAPSDSPETGTEFHQRVCVRVQQSAV